MFFKPHHIKMKLTFLGTSCMTPTKERNQQSLFLSYGSEGILIDCGEGTQRQMKIAGISLTKINKILLSHWHGDHVLGLPGILQSLGALEYTKTLKIYGPKGTKERIDHIFKAFPSDKQIKINVEEINEGVFFENQLFKLETMPLKHKIESLAFSFIEKDKRRIKIKEIEKLGIPEGPLLGKLQEGKNINWKGNKIDINNLTYIVKGKKLSIISDTILCDNCYKISENADLLVCESSYGSKLEDKAKKYFHLTAKQSALIANKSNVKKLILIHFSNRYKNTQELEEDARDFFDDVVCAEDFMKIKI